MFKKTSTEKSTDAREEMKDVFHVLIVDDEPEIHTITKIVLSGFRFEGHKVHFFSAYSGQQAIEIMREHPDVAVILLDVVMEEDDSGLQVAEMIRKDLGNRFVRIVLRTGQPGQAPKEKVIVDYDINDYREKTELDDKTMFCMMYAALRSYRDIMALEAARHHSERSREGLEKILEASSDLYQFNNLRQFAGGLLQQLSALLKLSDDALLIKASKSGNDLVHFDVVASSGAYEHYLDDKNGLPEDILGYFKRACERQQSFSEDDHYVGYFSNRKEDTHLLYLGGVRDFDELDKTLIKIYTKNVNIAFENLLLEQEIITTQSEIISVLGSVVENRSMEAGNHVKRVAQTTRMLALAYGMDEDEADLLYMASPLHDVGKIAIPDSILLKNGKLDDEEMVIMKRHAEIGATILGNSERPIIKTAAIIAAGHHEKYDGSGYPRGLKGDDIHIYARIVAVADVYDALMSKRTYKNSWSHDEAMQYLKEGSGTHFDPVIVKLLAENIETLKKIRQEYPG